MFHFAVTPGFPSPFIAKSSTDAYLFVGDHQGCLTYRNLHIGWVSSPFALVVPCIGKLYYRQI